MKNESKICGANLYNSIKTLHTHITNLIRKFIKCYLYSKWKQFIYMCSIWLAGGKQWLVIIFTPLLHNVNLFVEGFFFFFLTLSRIIYQAHDVLSLETRWKVGRYTQKSEDKTWIANSLFTFSEFLNKSQEYLYHIFTITLLYEPDKKLYYNIVYLYHS